MSLRVLTWVFQHSEATLADRLVLLALADYAHDEGGKAFPSIPTLAAKARVSERTVIRALQSLERSQEIEQTGTTRSGIKVYRVRLPHDNLSGVTNETAGVTSATAGGDKYGSALHKEPSTTNRKDPRWRDTPTAEEAPLSHLLADLVATNDPDHSRPRVGKTWADAERLLQERDGRSPTQIEYVIRWVMADGFEHAVVLSMPKLRQRYRELLAKANKRAPGVGASGTRANADSDIERLEAVKRALEVEEAGEARAA